MVQPPGPGAEFFAEFLDDFFAECDEHLGDMQRNLLALERSLGEPALDQERLEELFRSYHSLKGLAGMVGLREAELLAHGMEGYLRALREGESMLSSEGFEALVDATHALENAVASHRAARAVPDPGTLLARLAALLPARQVPQASRAVIATVQGASGGPEPRELARLQAARETGARVWRFTFVPTRELATRGVNVNEVRARLNRVGTVVRATPRVLNGGGIAFEFIVATAADEDVLAGWAADGLSHEPYEATLPAVSGAATASPAPPPAPAPPGNLVRVDLSRLDELMRLMGGLVITRARLAEQLEHLRTQLPRDTARALTDVDAALARQLRDLREAIMRVRLVPIGEAFVRMQFAVRDLAHEAGKEVVLDTYGQATEVDKYVVERMFDPLLHLVRNAVSHGLETPAERVAQGKTREGHLTLSAAAAGDSVRIEVADDGRGVNADLVATRARERGLLTGNGRLSGSALLDVLCTAGLSTRHEADRASGRGIGMAVVRRAVQELGGTLALDTAVGKGTRFVVTLPVTLAIVDALIVRVATQRFAAPLPPIREVVEVLSGATRQVQHGRVLHHRGVALPLIPLQERFALNNGTGEQHAGYALVVEGANGPVGIVVDRVLGQREIVVRALVDPLVQRLGLAGATELGDGWPVLILDLPALAGAGRTPDLRSSAGEREEPAV